MSFRRTSRISLRWWSAIALTLSVACEGGVDRVTLTPPEPSRELVAPEISPDVEPPTVPRLEFEAIALPGLEQATDFAFLPGAGSELLVLSHDGGVFHLRLEGQRAVHIGTSRIDVYRDEGCGLLSLALDVAFADNGFVYLGRCIDARTSRLSRHRFDPNGALEDGEVEILSVSTDRDPPEDWHRLGSFGFEPDGETLWVLVGDHFIKDLAQDAAGPFGALLRIVPNREDGGAGHTAAAGNAFEGGAGDPRVFARGLRSPWRATRDSRGRFFVGDVGEWRREEVNVITRAGQNFGWPRFEGPCSSECDGFENPIASYGRSSDELYVLEDAETYPEGRRSVWVSDVYEQPSIDRYYGLFDGRVVFGDFFTGWVRALATDESGALVQDQFVGHLRRVSAWHTGRDGYMYALTHDGTLHRAIQALDAN